MEVYQYKHFKIEGMTAHVKVLGNKTLVKFFSKGKETRSISIVGQISLDDVKAWYLEQYVLCGWLV